MNLPLRPEPAEHDTTGHACGCGEASSDEPPTLDARTIPHTVRHATIHGALGAVAPASSLVLVAPHDPLPLLREINERHPGGFEVHYLERGPEAWRLQFTRVA